MTGTIHSETTGNYILNQYKEKGYFLAKNLLDKSKIKAANQWLDSQDQKSLTKSWTEQEPGVDLAVFSVIHKGDHPLAEIANNTQMLQIAGELMGAPVYIWSSKINMKAAWCGTVEYYHQDFVYWKDRGYPSDRMMSCMVFLEHHSFQNGGLCVFPGSHKKGFIEHDSFININGLAKSMVPPQTLNQLNVEYGWESITAEPGDVLFFHTNLVHGSAHNISPKSRRILLSQLNVIGNEPTGVAEKSREFNLKRAQQELVEAQRKLDWFKKKYDEQLASSELTFCPPIPEHERNLAKK